MEVKDKVKPFVKTEQAISNAEGASYSPFSVKEGLFDAAKSNLGLEKIDDAKTITIFAAEDKTDHYVNGAVMTEFKGRIYCQWQSSSCDEDTEDTWVAYSVSDDGIKWSKPSVLMTALKNSFCTSGGWFSDGDTLIAYINVWKNNAVPLGGSAYYIESKDGVHWSEMKPVLMTDGTEMRGVIEQDIYELDSGRLVSAAHFQPGLSVNPIYTDDSSGKKGWICAKYKNIPAKDGSSREIEPSLFVNSDKNIVMIFRDQNSSFHKLASLSKDNGEIWSEAVLTNMPDSRSKQSAGNLPDGTAYMVGNPVTDKHRIPLAIALSKDGKIFDAAYALRTAEELPELIYEGRAKRLGYHYPKSAIIGDYLYVSYSTNKERIEFTKIPLDKISLN